MQLIMMTSQRKLFKAFVESCWLAGFVSNTVICLSYLLLQEKIARRAIYDSLATTFPLVKLSISTNGFAGRLVH